MPLVNRLITVVFYVLLFTAVVAKADTECSFVGQTAVENVVWTESTGVNTDGNSLVKTAPEGWNSAAFSSEHIADNGALEFTVKGASASRMVGFAYVNTDERFEGIDYAVFMTSYGRLYIFEKGIQRGNYTTYNDNDVIRIERKNGTVSYLKNGNEIYVSKVPSFGDLYVDSSLYTEGATIDDAKIYGAGTATVNVEWMDMVNVEVKQDLLVNTGGKGWSSGAASIQNMLGDGAVEFTVQNDDDTVVFGLSRENEDAGYKKIDYAIYISSNGLYYVYENGFNKGSFGKYDATDVFRIERRGTKITYVHNCEPFYVSKRSSQGKLLVDVALHSKNARISKAIMYGASL